MVLDKGARGAPPINRLAVTIKFLRHYIFAMRLLVVKYMACKLLTDTTIKTINKKYPCQVVLDKGARGAPPINRIEVTIEVLQLYIFAMLFAVLK